MLGDAVPRAEGLTPSQRKVLDTIEALGSVRTSAVNASTRRSLLVRRLVAKRGDTLRLRGGAPRTRWLKARVALSCRQFHRDEDGGASIDAHRRKR
jgi:hypothetical protein